MAGRIAYYGNIVRDGLVLDLDAAKRDSYPGSGTVWRDIAGGVITGSLIGGPTFDPNNGGSIVFNGTNDYVSLNNVPIGSRDFSFDIWIKKSPTIKIEFIMGNYADQGASGVMVFIQNGTTVRFRISIGAGSYAEINQNISNNVWVNLIFTANRTGNMVGYINGVPTAQSSIISQQGNLGNVDFLSSFYGGAWFLSGSLSSTRVYNRALSAAEVTQNYNALKGRFGL